MRNTRQKKLIYDIIVNSYAHPTALQIYKEAINVIPDISLGTVYRNLNMLVDNDSIVRIKMPDGIDRYDKCLEHAHIICSNCGHTHVGKNAPARCPVCEHPQSYFHEQLFNYL